MHTNTGMLEMKHQSGNVRSAHGTATQVEKWEHILHSVDSEY